MMHRQSNDPVLVKKISLRVWSLRDEVEARIKVRLVSGEEEGQEASDDLKDLVQDYSPKTLVIDNTPLPKADGKPDLNLIKGGQAEEAAAPGADASPPEESMPAGAENIDLAPPVDPKALAPEGAKEEKQVVHQLRAHLDADKVFAGRTLLAEVYMDRMLFFCGQKFYEGQSIVIEFVIPKRFTLNADVIYCRPYSMKSRIISNQKLPYRLAVKFTFLRPGERTLLREFLVSVEPDGKDLKQKDIKPQKVKKESDGLDDLADLDV